MEIFIDRLALKRSCFASLLILMLCPAPHPLHAQAPTAPATSATTVPEWAMVCTLPITMSFNRAWGLHGSRKIFPIHPLGRRLAYSRSLIRCPITITCMITLPSLQPIMFIRMATTVWVMFFKNNSLAVVSVIRAVFLDS